MPRQRLYQRVYQVKHLVKTLLTGKKTTDDFDWDLYTQHYRGELKHVEETATAVLQPGDYAFENNTLIKKSQVKPLHDNHFLLYETILQLHPASALEVGCGGGDMLANLATLDANLHLFGQDRSDKQLSLLHQRHPKLRAKVLQHDITSGPAPEQMAVDLVFTQAVIMHIKTGDNHRRALANMFRMAAKYVVLMENWRDHDFVDDLKQLQSSGQLDWSSLHLSARPYPGNDKPYILIASKEQLPQYTPITSDEQLRQI